jgi:hypothetical protein
VWQRLNHHVHFRDDLKDGQMVFDFKMCPGIVQKSNAMALLTVVGVGPDDFQESPSGDATRRTAGFGSCRRIARCSGASG